MTRKKAKRARAKLPSTLTPDERAHKIVATYGWGSDVEPIVEALGGDLLPFYSVDTAQEMGGEFDLLLLQGGTDISPEIYDQVNKGKCQTPNVTRDQVELTLVSEAIRRHVPVLGICRGNQMLAAALGGTLHQDIGGKHCFSNHKINWYAQGNRRQYTVNSLHHQAVDKMPRDFEVLARADDGTVEGIFSRRLKAMGVQFHPEMLSEHNEQWLTVFQWWYGGFMEIAPIRKVEWYKPVPAAFSWKNHATNYPGYNWVGDEYEEWNEYGTEYGYGAKNATAKVLEPAASSSKWVHITQKEAVRTP